MPKPARLPAYRVYLILSGCSLALFAMLSTVSGAFQVEAAHLNPLQLVLVGTALEASTFLCEVPTGVVADVYSRRLSVIIGVFLTGLGFVLWGAFTRFETILLAQVVWGVGFTFTSGATEAWLADEVGEERAGRAFLRGAQAGQVGALVGILASVVLASVRLGLPLVVSGLLYLALGAFLVLFMPETSFVRSPHAAGGTWPSMRGQLRAGLGTARGRPVLLTILVISVIFGAASEGHDRLNVAHFIEDIGLPTFGRFDPVVWFGVMSAGGLLLSLIAAEVTRRRLNTSSHYAVAAVLAAINALLTLTVVGFALSGSFGLALAAFWATALLRRTSVPLKTIWTNQNLEPSIRATVFSLTSQADALGQITLGPAIGALAAAVSVRTGIAVAGLMLLPALLLYAGTLRTRPQPEAVAPGSAP